MNTSPTNGQSRFRLELILQAALFLVVFIFYAYSRSTRSIQYELIVFFIPYAIISLIINYKLLPAYFYKKKYWQFILGVLCLVFAVMLVEELVTEKIFYPETRGISFPGVFFGLVQILPSVIILCSFKFAWDALTKQNELEALEKAVKDSQLQFLKSQINPHFLFNNLNNLYSHALENSPKTPEIILELSSVLRYMLYECKEEFVPLNKELTQLENYIRLNELQLEGRGIVNFSKENISGDYQIAPLILMVFIENAFKHSQSSLTEGIAIDINIRITENGKLKFTCKNNYQAQSNVQQLSNGIGLNNVRQRLEFLYPDSHELNISESGNSYKVELVMQLVRMSKQTKTQAEMNYDEVLPLKKVLT